MMLSESMLENSVKLTSEFVAPILSCKSGDQKETLKIDGVMFASIVAMQILFPILVSVTSAVISSKLLDKNKSMEELTKELRELIGKTIAPVDGKKKEELIGIVEEKIGKYGASHKQARELVDLILAKYRGEKEVQRKEGWQVMNFIRYFFMNVHNSRGLVFEKKGFYEKAIYHYNKAIKVMPWLAIPYYNRGNIYERLRDYDRAINDYRKAIELNPKYSEAYNNLGKLYFGIEQYALAESCFRAAIEINPHNDEAFSNLGGVFTFINDYENAIKCYDRALLSRNSKKLYGYYYNRGIAYGEKGDLGKAIQDFSKAIELNPRFAEAYYNRGMAYNNTGDNEGAKKDYIKAEELNKEIEQSYTQDWHIYKNRRHT